MSDEISVVVSSSETIEATVSGITLYPSHEVDPYKGLRPSDWIEMPDTIGDNEIYLLFHLANTDENLIAFSANCTGNYTVSLGTVVDGAFVQSSSSTLASGVTYEDEIDYASWGNSTSKGFRQVMIKVTGADITSFAPATHTKKTSPANYMNWNIVDIAARAPSVTSFACGNALTAAALGCLYFFALHGMNQIANASNMFRNCRSLMLVSALDFSSAVYAGSTFYSCVSLVSLPDFNTPNLINTNSMYRGSAIRHIPAMNTSSVTNMGTMCYGCYSLVTLPALDTSDNENFNGMFQMCYSLASLPALDTSSATDTANMVSGCNSLAEFLLVPTATWTTPQAISIADASLSHTAIVALFNSLPTIGTAKAITLTGNPGVGELTAEDQLIATGKGWTLVL